MKVRNTAILRENIRCIKCGHDINIEDYVDLNGYGEILELEGASCTRVQCPRKSCGYIFWVKANFSIVCYFTTEEIE